MLFRYLFLSFRVDHGLFTSSVSLFPLSDEKDSLKIHFPGRIIAFGVQIENKFMRVKNFSKFNVLQVISN